MERVRFADSDSTVELSSFVHFSEGLGTPVASQNRVTFVPSTTCGDCGDTITSVAATEQKNRGKKNKISN